MASTGVTPTVSPAPSITLYSLKAWLPSGDARMTMILVFTSRSPWRRTSSKAKLSKTSISSGSVSFTLDT